MRRVARQLLLGVLTVAILFVVLRAIVVPLARQRQERREKTPTILALIPADTDEWVLRRKYHRRFPLTLWPDSPRRIEKRAEQWGIPLQAILEELELSRIWGATWVAGKRGEDHLFLIGAFNRLKPDDEVGGILTAAPDTVLSRGDYFIRRRGIYFTVCSQREPLPTTSWLEKLPPWREVGDLLMSGDWLEYHRSGDGGVLVGASTMFGLINCQGLAWGCPDGVEELTAAIPGSWEGRAEDLSRLEALPTLRRSPPFDPEGVGMTPVSANLVERPQVQIGWRSWRRGGYAALQKVIRER